MKINSKYLNGDVVQWLVEDELSFHFLQRCIPVIKFDFKKDTNSIIHFHRLYSLHKKAYQFFDSPGVGIMWIFSSLVECGLDVRDNKLYSMIKDILRFQQDDGGFTLNWKPFCSTGCITGQLVCSLLESRYQGKELEKGIAWILDHQRYDGGWLHCPIGSFSDSLKYLFFKRTGQGIRLEHTDVPSCALATVMCVKALMKMGSDNANDRIKRAIAYLLNNNAILKETGCRCRVAYNHELLGYPFYLDYDSIDAIHLSLLLGKKVESLRIQLFNQCIKKQFEDGRFPLEHRRRGCLHDFLQLPVKEGKHDKLTTIRVLSMLFNTGNASLE
ncbi:MAG: hypothetical protein N3F66_08325 [Spirochaetes bacterium]|nr:hypothetical protein [Spirochaetota bacterium]